MRIGIAALLLLAIAGDSQAQVIEIEWPGYLAIGGLVLTPTPDIEIRSEELYVSEKEIRVRYRFFNTSKTDIKTLVAFPLPDLSYPVLQWLNLMIADPGPTAHWAMPNGDLAKFLAFETRVEGIPVTYGMEQRAIVNGTDTTDLLKSLHIPITTDLNRARESLDALSQEQRERLVRAGVIYEDRRLDYRTPKWMLTTAFHWEQIFPSQKDLIVEHRYTPYVSRNVGRFTEAGRHIEHSLNIITDYKTRYCTDDDFLAAAQRPKKAAGAERFPEGRLEYVLAAGANGAAPIKDFRLVVDKGEPDSLVSFCAEGVKKIGPTQFEVHYKDYTPDQNLQVLILHR